MRQSRSLVAPGKDRPFRPGDRLGKYRLIRRLGEGGSSQVWKALDGVEGIHVALKFPLPGSLTPSDLEDFRREARIVASFDHPNILKIKNADVIEGHFVITYEMGRESLGDRLLRPISTALSVEIVRQVLEGLAYAHARRVIHRDIKPDNVILFDGPIARITDFGISRILKKAARARRGGASAAAAGPAPISSLSTSGSGTLGYMAPEQAYGRPCLASDVFAVGLILYEMLTGAIPEWPFEPPYPREERLRRRGPAGLVAVIRRATAFRPEDRFRDAGAMLEALRKVEPLVRLTRRPRRRPGANRPRRVPSWREIRMDEFRRRAGEALDLHYRCYACEGPISEAMLHCPWCGVGDISFRDVTDREYFCERCERGIAPEWRFCPWCYGPGFDGSGRSPRPDHRYTEACADPQCPGHRIMPFMRYCPWCHRKVRKPWRHPLLEGRCRSCGWSIDPCYWDFCPWCGTTVRPAR